MGSVYEEITRLETAKADIETAIEGCGVNVPDTDLISTYALYIRQIPSAVFSELNADPVGGEDKYIQKIELKDGLINATAGGLVSSTSSGIVPKIGTAAAATIATQADEWVLTTTKGGEPTWRKLPTNAFKNDNTTYTFVSGNGGFTVTPSGGTAQVVSIGKVDWANITNKPNTFTPSAHTHATDNITKLTSYTKATSASDLATTDTLNTALGKLEYKADYAYDWIISVTASDTDEYINKWSEIVGFLDSVKEGTDILDEFVTRKTNLTITGLKTFKTNTGNIKIEDASVKIDMHHDSGWSRCFEIINTNNSKTVTSKFGAYGHGNEDGNNVLYYTFISHGSLEYNNATLKIYDNKATISGNEIYHKGNLKNLSDLNDDIVSGKYLPLTGGKLNSGTDTPLVILGTDHSWIGFKNSSGTNLGWIGVLNSYLPSFYSDKSYKIWHEGNLTKVSQLSNDAGFLTSAALGNYVTLNTALTITGVKTFSSLQKFTVALGTSPFLVTSNTIVSNLNANYINGYQSSQIFKELGWNTSAAFKDCDNTGRSYGIIINLKGNYTDVINYPHSYGFVLNFLPGGNSYTGVQISVKEDGSDIKIRDRWNSGSWNEWRTLIHNGNYGSYLGYIGTTAVQASSAALALTGITNLTMNGTYTNNNKLVIHSSGCIYPYSTSTRTAGMYGKYDSTKVGHVWSMGTDYKITDDGSSTNNMYGLVYFHTNWSNDKTRNTATRDGSLITEVSTYAGGHQIAFVVNGQVKVALGDRVWSRAGFLKSGSSDSYVLLGGGGHKKLSDFLLKSEELTNNLTTLTKTLVVSKDWVDTGIVFNAATFPNGTGSYIVQLSREDTYYWTGCLSIVISNNITAADSDEILLHGGGYDSGFLYYLRTVHDTTNKVVKLQIARNSTYSTSRTYTFKFKKLI